MRKLLLLALLLTSSFAWGVACPAGYTLTATVLIKPQSNLSADVSSYQLAYLGHPALASIANGGNMDNADTTGLGAVFCDATGTNVVAYELVPGTYNATTGAGEWHVAVATLSRTATTILTLKIGKSGATDMSCGPSGTNNCGTTLWNNFKLVLHGGTSSSLSVTDSSGTNTPTNHSTTAGTGQIKGAPTFVSASSEYIDIGAANSLATVSVLEWVKLNILDSCGLIISNLANPTFNGYELIQGMNNSGSCTANGQYAWQIGNAGNLYLVVFPNAVTTAGFHMIGATQTSTTVALYQDGLPQTGTVIGTPRTIGTTTTNLNLGRFSGAASNYADAIIDESRVYAGVLTPDYYLATYYNHTFAEFYQTVYRAAAHYCIATAGSDSASGLYPSNCWQTITKVNSYAASPGFVPGDEISFNGGDTFTGPITITAALGDPTGTVTFDSYGTGKATITSGNGVVDGITLTNSEYVTIKNLIFTGTGWTGTGTGVTVLNGGTGINLISTNLTKQRNDIVTGTTISGYQNGMITDARGSASYGAYQNLVVYNNNMSNNLTGGFLWQGFNAGTGSVTQFKNVYVGYNTFKSIPGDPNSGTGGVHGSVHTEAWSVNGCNTTGVVIERNLSLDIAGFGGATSGLPGGGSSAIQLCASRNFTITHNETGRVACSKDVDGSAIDLDVNTQTGEVAYNLSYNDVGAAVQFGSFSGSPTTNGNIHHNISFNDARGNNAASKQGAFRFWSGTNGINLYNNTVYVDSTGTTGTPSAISFDTGGGAVPDANVLVTNNILKVTGGIAAFYSDTGAAPTSMTTVANLYDFSSGSAVFGNSTGGTPWSSVSTLSAWQALGFEKYNTILYGVVGNADLLNLSFSPPSTGVGVPLENVANFNLGSSSAAIGAGVLPWLVGLGPTTTDYHRSNFQTSNLVDIGASSYPQPAGSGSTSPGPIVIQ